MTAFYCTGSIEKEGSVDTLLITRVDEFSGNVNPKGISEQKLGTWLFNIIKVCWTWLARLPRKKSVFDYLISITKWLPIAILKNFKFDNSETKQAMKMHIMSNSTIFAKKNPMKLLFFKFEII